MVKRGKNQKQKHWNSMNSKSKKNEDVDMNDMDDEIDAFHKQRDMIPLDVDADSGDSDEDDVQPVFEYKGIDGSDDEDEDEDDNDDDDKVNYRDKGLAAKIVRQQKYLREKTGGVDDDISEDDAEEDDNGTAWSRSKNIYYGDENELSEEELAEEEKEVRRLQQERAESLQISDFFNPDVSDGEPTLGEMKLKGRKKSSGDKEAEDDAVPMNVEVKKDLDAMSKDEQMDVLYRCAPELPGLLAELNDSYNQLETQVNPLLGKVKKGDNAKKEGKNYLEVKQVLLHAYSQAIVFYLLLRSEGQPSHDHPVIARIVEIKSLLDKMKELDQFIPDGLEDALNEMSAASVQRPAAKHPAASFNTSAELNELIGGVTEKRAVSEFQEATDGVKKQPTKINEKKRKLQDRPVSSDSVKMFEKRAELEANFKKKCASGFVAPRTDGSKKKIQKTITGKLETTDDFDDDAVQLGGATRDNGSLSSKLSRILPANKKKVISGDDDLPERDDLGERRWKHELRVLSSAGIRTNTDDVELGNEPESLSPGEDDVEDNVEVDGSEDDYYEQCKRELDHKRRSKAAKYSRNPEENVLEAETTVDGKREFTSWMEKNRGLTRNRKKQNPRVVKRKKYEDAKKRRKGQVREIKKPTGGYGGETTGINTRVTKSIKFK